MSEGKIGILKRSQGHATEIIYKANSIPLKSRRNINFGVALISTIFLLNEKRKLVENLSFLTSEWKGQLCFGQKPPLDLIFCTEFNQGKVREF